MFIPAKPLIALAAAGALLAGCTPAPAGVTPVQAAPSAATPLEAVIGYRLQASLVGSGGAATLVAVNGVAPPVSGRAASGRSFMLRPDTHEVYCVDPSGKTFSWGGLGAEPGRFNQPSSLVVTEDRVYVADTNNHRIQAFDFDGGFITAWGKLSSATGQLNHPRSIEVTPGGTLVVVDDVRLQYYAPDGTCLGAMPLNVAANSTAKQPDSAETALIATMSTDIHADIYAFMALFQKMSQEMRSSARESRDADMQAQVATLNAAADQIRDAASARFAAAVLQGSVQLAAGIAGVSSTGGVRPLTPPIGGIKVTAGGSSSVMRAAGDIGTVKQLEADKARIDADAQVHEASVQHANDLMQQMMDVIRDVREKLQAIEQSRAETNQGIARNI